MSELRKRLLLFCLPGLIGTISFGVMAAPPASNDDAAKDLVDAAAALADEAEAGMFPAEKDEFDRKVQESAYAEMEAVAHKCGTKLHFTTERKIEDRRVYAHVEATKEQIACVRAELPFVEPEPVR